MQLSSFPCVSNASSSSSSSLMYFCCCHHYCYCRAKDMMMVIDAICLRNGRPGSQAVSEKFSVDWGTYMSSHNDVVYIKLDVRGARGQGSRSLYRHLGGVEVQDQITVLRSVVKLPGHCQRILTGKISDKPSV